MKKFLHNFWRFIRPTTYAKSLQLVLILFIAVSIPLIVYVQQKQQTLKQHAADNGCTSVGQSCGYDQNCTTSGGQPGQEHCSGTCDNSLSCSVGDCGGPGNCSALPATPTPVPPYPTGGSGSIPSGQGGCCDPGTGYGCRTTGGYTEVCDIGNGACQSGYSCRSAQPTGETTATPAQCAHDTDCGWPGRQIWCDGGICTPGSPPSSHCQTATSLQARFQLNGTDSWGTSKTLTSQLPINAALFRNTTAEYAGSAVNGVPIPDTIAATISGPNGFNKSLSTSDLASAYSFTPPANGTYTLSGNCQSGAVNSDTATITVSGISTTPTPTPTGTSGGGGTPTPLPSGTSGDTTVAFTVTMPYAPQTQRTMKVELTDSSGNISSSSANITYLSTDSNGNTVLTGSADLGTSFTTGTYDIRIDSAPYVQIIPGITVTAGQSNPATPTDPMLIGDINGDWKIDVADYNILLGCNFNAVNPPTITSDCKKADLNNDGVVDGIDYNILVRGWQAAEKDNL